MAAGLGFKDFVSGEVLAAADVDGYLMQGIWVFDDAAARDAAVTSPQEGNACYLKDTNEVLTYSGSVWVAVGGGSPLTTKGDLYTFSTVDARLAVGANDTVLTADSSEATGLKWAAAATASFTAFTPSFTGITLGNGTLVGRKLTVNGLETIFVKLTWGSTTSITGNVVFNTPSTMANGSENQQFVMGYRDADTTNQYLGTIYFFNNSSFYTGILGASGQYANTISATSPFTWTTNDTQYFLIQYEV
jgi:hypothetical protein